jgi:hypothetical protein
MIEIYLTQNKVALIDDEDWELISQYKWYAEKQQNSSEMWYAKTNKPKSIRMHRLIIDAQNGEEVDHINHNGLDNRRNNLRIATKSENAINNRKRKKTTSKYKGVSWDKKQNKWHAYIHINGKKIHIGSFEDEILAAKAYDVKSLSLHKEFSNPNFREKVRETLLAITESQEGNT